ncbi:MAG: hypothetical protein DLM55_10775 [Acidimicrobiales bacterium]|nr:MAG: hypothetical protein DLM55_10775 [Acidimicrobiales bacterium]
MTSPIDPTEQHPSASPDPQPPIDSGAAPPKSGLDRFTSKQKLAGVLGILLVLALCACCGATGIGALVSNNDDKKSTKHAAEPPKSSVSIAEPGRLIGEGEVTGISAGDAIEVAMADGTRLVHISGTTAPVASSGQCWAEESRKFAEQNLSGKKVKLFISPGQTDPGKGAGIDAHAVLSDGTNYGVAALEAGAVRADINAKLPELLDKFTAAQKQASDAKRGLWGGPCNGSLTPPAPSAPAQPSTPPAAESQNSSPQSSSAPQQSAPSTKAPASGSGGGAVYYSNCAAAKAAGAAPLHIGQPGYRAALDRDHDGVACE